MNFIKTTIAVCAVLFAVSCTKDAPSVEYLDVTAHNLSGSWELVEWNGSKLDEGTYMFVNFVRKDREFTIYQNFDSIGKDPHVVTGRFNIYTDEELGAIIRGDYNYDSGVWAHRYIVKDLTSDSMIWIATDDETYIQKFVRIPAIPEDLKGTEE